MSRLTTIFQIDTTLCRSWNFHQSTSLRMQIYWSRHETLRRDKSAPRRQTDSPAVWDSGWEPVFVQGMGIGAGLAAMQWPGIGSSSQFWAWHTAGEIGWQSSTCMFGQLFAWTPLKGEAPTPTEYWLLHKTGWHRETCVLRTLWVEGEVGSFEALSTSKGDCFSSKEDLSGRTTLMQFGLSEEHLYLQGVGTMTWMSIEAIT